MVKSTTTLVRIAAIVLYLVSRGAQGLRIQAEEDRTILSDTSAQDSEEQVHTGTGSSSSRSQQQQELKQQLRRKLQQQLPANSDNVEESWESHKVTSLPLAESLPTDLYAGMLNASADGDKRFFYWLVAPPKETVSPTTPLLIWLNGGPGCSSNDGFFLENGPLQFSQDSNGEWKLTPNPHSWHLAPAWVLYVDQPVGTGLSVTYSGSYPTNDEQVNQDFTYFFEEFLLFHQDIFQRKDNGHKISNPVFFSGESHAGHYIPSIMDYWMKQPHHRVDITLGGAAIGNGWVDPYHQYAAAEAAYGMGIINKSQKKKLDLQEIKCQTELRNGNYHSTTCRTLLDAIVNQSYGSHSDIMVSMYDATRVERTNEPRSFPDGHDLVASYLGGGGGRLGYDNVQAVLNAIHATESLQNGQRYRECADAPYDALKHQDGLGVVQEVVNLLEANIPMLFFNGINDLVCNHVGTETMLFELPWSQVNAFITAPRYTWMIDDDDSIQQGPAAYVHEWKNLKYLKIPNAGHMMPADQPKVALQMMQTFLHAGSFKQHEQYLERVAPSAEANSC